MHITISSKKNLVFVLVLGQYTHQQQQTRADNEAKDLQLHLQHSMRHTVRQGPNGGGKR
jgi:hypothetical protein